MGHGSKEKPCHHLVYIPCTIIVLLVGELHSSQRSACAVQWPARLAGWVLRRCLCAMVAVLCALFRHAESTSRSHHMYPWPNGPITVNDMQAHRTGHLLHGCLPQHPSHPIPFASRRNRAATAKDFVLDSSGQNHPEQWISQASPIWTAQSR